MKMIEVQPAAGRKIRNPDLGMQHLPADQWTLVRWSTYWQQLIIDGDVIEKDEKDAA